MAKDAVACSRGASSKRWAASLLSDDFRHIPAVPTLVQSSRARGPRTQSLQEHGMPVLDREEYIEQAYFFHAFRERVIDGLPSQDVLGRISEELLSTTRLPLAVSFL